MKHALRRGARVVAAVAVVSLLQSVSPAFAADKPDPAPPSLKPFVPKNVTPTAVFCEEVYVNPSEAAFITSPPGAASGVTLQTLTGQAAYIGASKIPLQFPKDALEVKADWLPAAS